MEIWTPDQSIMALSWKQPYAELMLHGKQETRTWQTKYRGWVLLCASKSPYTEEIVGKISGTKQVWRMAYYLNGSLSFRKYDFNGHAFAIGRLVDCQPMSPKDENDCFVLYRKGLWRHIYEDVTRIEPIPWKGNTKWLKVSQDIKNQIKIIK